MTHMNRSKADVRIAGLHAEGLLQLKDMDCSPLPVERDSVYILFYRLFRDTCRMAYIGDELVGFLLGVGDQADPGHVYIHYLFVKEQHREAGIGGMLLNALIGDLRQRGFHTVTLMTGSERNAAYYAKFGFKPHEEQQRNSMGDPVTAYMLEQKKVLFFRLEL